MSYQLLLQSLIFFLFFPLTAYAAFWSPHIGGNYKYWDIEPYEQYEPLFPRIKQGFNFYAGTRINGFFGFDIGYEQSHEKRQTQVFEGGEIIFATPQTIQLVTPEKNGDSAQVDLRVHDIYLDLNFYWEVVRRFEVLFMMGAAFVHPHTHIFHLSGGNWVEFSNDTEAKWMGRIGIGAQFNPIPCFGIKALVYGDQIRRLNYVGENEHHEFYNLSPYHKAISVTLGIVYSFSNPRRHVYRPDEDPPFY